MVRKNFERLINILLIVSLFTILCLWFLSFLGSRGENKLVEKISLWFKSDNQIIKDAQKEVSQKNLDAEKIEKDLINIEVKLRELVNSSGLIKSVYGGCYFDLETKPVTLNLLLTEISEETKELILQELVDFPDFFINFVQVKHSIVKLEEYLRKLEKTFIGVSVDEVSEIYSKYEEPLRSEIIAKLMEERKKDISPEYRIPLNSLNIIIKANALSIGLKEIKPEYITLIRSVIGEEVAVEFHKELDYKIAIKERASMGLMREEPR